MKERENRPSRVNKQKCKMAGKTDHVVLIRPFAFVVNGAFNVSLGSV